MARAGAFLRGAPAVRDGSPPPDEPAVPGSWAARAGATAPSDPAGSPTPDEPAAPGSWAARAGAAARGVPAARDGSDPTDEPAVPGSWAARASATAPSGPGVRDGSAAPGGPAAPGSWAARDGAAAHGGPVAPGGHAAATVAGGPVDPAPTLATVRRLPVRVPREDRDPGSVMLGQSVQDGRSVSVELAALRRHAAIFAGSGSGKTVLIRRLVEECALRGVSSIVLDPNNDLARLGDPWPQPPAAWDELEVARAEAYHRSTDVVVWTPRRTAGRPLSFRPLPDFAGILDDPDAFAAGVDAAVASLAPRANVDGASTKARIGNAVLREALTAYARGGGSDLREFVLYLTRLPARVSQLDNAPKVANELGQLLRATMVSDPLFGGDGAPLDPGELLKPAPGYRARISVISFIGLPDDGQRQSFVNQLQLALFAWIKRHPAGDRPLGGLLVMDEAQTLAPSGAMTACTQSTLALASQARKYGLGLVFATQAPKGLHNRIPGNAATQLFGLLNSPTQIEAAKEMARAKGSDISDVARLRPGVFYAAVDGAGFAKMRAPLCLSHHPASPLTVEEVIARAQDVDDDDDE
nr:DUF87 domain-containing protein [Asanoa hainanensis]